MDFGGGRSLQRIGFVTQKDLSDLGIAERVAVYCPHSYNFSGNLYFVPPEQVHPLELDAADAMKYVISGGISNIETS